jgi:acyl carrier protein
LPSEHETPAPSGIDAANILESFLVVERGLSVAQAQSTALFSSAILDSLDLVRLLAFIESRFQVAIPVTEANIANFDSIAAISSLISRVRR